MSGITCKNCLTGQVQQEVPTGTVETVHDLQSYVARPQGEAKGVVVIITDIFGWELTNSRLMADFYAKEGGYLAYVPDFMNGMIAIYLLSEFVNKS